MKESVAANGSAGIVDLPAKVAETAISQKNSEINDLIEDAFGELNIEDDDIEDIMQIILRERDMPNETNGGINLPDNAAAKSIGTVNVEVIDLTDDSFSEIIDLTKDDSIQIVNAIEDSGNMDMSICDSRYFYIGLT